MLTWLTWQTALAAPTPLHDYTALMSAIEAGEPVRAVIRYGQCLLDSEPGPGAIGGMVLDTFEVFPKGSIGNPVGFLSASQTRLTHHPAYGQVFHYLGLKVHEDARVEVTARYLEPRKHKVVMEQVFGCALTPHGGLALFAGEAP